MRKKGGRKKEKRANNTVSTSNTSEKINKSYKINADDPQTYEKKCVTYFIGEMKIH